MSDFSQWFSEQDEVLYPRRQKPEFEDAYEAGFRAASDKAATLPQRAMFDAGYERGRIAGMEEAMEIAEQKAEYHQNTHKHTQSIGMNYIATAIRERMK